MDTYCLPQYDLERLYFAQNASAAKRLMRKLIRHYKNVREFLMPRMHKKNMQTRDFVQVISAEAQKRNVRVTFLPRQKWRKERYMQRLVCEIRTYYAQERERKKQKKMRAQATLEAHQKREKEKKLQRQRQAYQAGIILLQMGGNDALAKTVSQKLGVPLLEYNVP